MFNFIIECISLSIISLIIISIGYYIYDYYISTTEKKNNLNENNNEIDNEIENINIDELESLLNTDEEELCDEKNKDNNEEDKIVEGDNNDEENKQNEDTIKKNGKEYKIKKNNSLSSMDELDTIKSSLNKMLNDLNTKN
jgi:hypothetical protein